MADNDTATQQGAENDELDKGTPQLNPRNDYLEQIAAQHERRREEELGIAGEEPSGDPAPEINPTPADPGQKFTVKVDGVETEVTQDELVRSYQKEAAANKRLQDASLKLSGIEERERALAERERLAAEREAQVTQQQQEPSATDQDIDAEVQATLDAIYGGDEQAAKDALKKLVTSGRQPATQQGAQQEVAIPDVTAQVLDQIDRMEALEKFNADFSDVVSDPYLAGIADRFFADEIKEKGFADALVGAGEKTRDWLKKQVQASSGNGKPSGKSKADIDNLETANATAAGANDAEVDESPSAIIANMRKARGLAS